VDAGGNLVGLNGGGPLATAGYGEAATCASVPAIWDTLRSYPTIPLGQLLSTTSKVSLDCLKAATSFRID